MIRQKEDRRARGVRRGGLQAAVLQELLVSYNEPLFTSNNEARAD
jgi:hypothetical protein